MDGAAGALGPGTGRAADITRVGRRRTRLPRAPGGAGPRPERYIDVDQAGDKAVQPDFFWIGRLPAPQGTGLTEPRASIRASARPRLTPPGAVGCERHARQIRADSTGDKFIRVIDLLDRLGNTRVGLTTAELAEAFEVNVRSAQRYIRQLRDDVGLDIVSVDGRYKLGEGTRLPALQFDRDQAAALLIAVRLLQQLYPDRDPALVGAMARRAAALKVPTVTDLLGRFIETVEKRPENPLALQLRRTVVEAFTGQLKLEIEYTDAQGHRSGPGRRPVLSRAAFREPDHLHLRPRRGVHHGAPLPARPDLARPAGP